MPIVPLASPQQAEVIEGAVFSVAYLARACNATERWVHDHVEAGVITAQGRSGEWYFDSVSLVRARRVALLESVYDADPQLAALTADLIEEVTVLRSVQRTRPRNSGP